MRRVADEADSTRYHCPGSLLVKLDRQEPKLFKCIAQVLCGLGLTLSHPFRADVVRVARSHCLDDKLLAAARR